MKNKILIVLAVIVVAAGAYYLNEKSKVKVTEVLEGVGATASKGQTAVFDYRAFIFDPSAAKNLGKEFDSTYSRQTPMKIVLGEKQVIPGLDKAIIGMKVGGQREVVIAPSMAYGDSGAGGGLVPPKATLIYLVELRSIE